MSIKLSDDTKQQNQLILSAIGQCQKYFLDKKFDSNGKEQAGFDSIGTDPKQRPDCLNALFDSIGHEYAPKVDKAVQWGLNLYRQKHGADATPHASVIASAITGANGLAQNIKKEFPEIAQFDDVSNLNYEQASIVPALSVVTIANVIASSLPMVAQIPNVNGSVRIPVVAVRMSTDQDFGAMAKGEYLDGSSAGNPYAEGRFKFVATSTDQKNYTITAYTRYKDYKAGTPDTSSTLLPFLGANVSIRVNGKEVGSTRTDRANSVISGTINAHASQKPAVIAGKEYRMVSGTVNLDTSKVDIVFSDALPSTAVVHVTFIADFDRKDKNGKDFALDPVGVNFTPEYDDIQAVPSVQQVHLNLDVQNQLANELGFGFMATALSAIQGKMFLEQNLRLLGECKERAIYNGRYSTFDITRGVAGNLTASYNTTADMMSEFTKFLSKAKLKIGQASGGSTVGYNAFVGDNGAIFFNQMSRDKFTPTGLTASYGEIVRIGTLSDGTDVYHSPTPQGLIEENESATQVVVIGRGSEPVRNPMVGSMVMAPTIRTASKDTRETVMGVHTIMAAELNPLDRYADQCAVIEIINLVDLGE